MAHDSHNPNAVGHIVPPRMLFTVGGALLVLTVLTVITAKYVDLGSFNIWLAFIIAGTKAALVLLYFMHLRWDSPFNAIILISSLAFVILFIGFSLSDTAEYEPYMMELETRYAPAAPSP